MQNQVIANLTTIEHAASSQQQPTATLKAWQLAAVGILTFLACYLRDFVFPDVPVLFWGDQLLYATNGSRMLAGQMPYRDFFEFLPAGTDLVYASLFRLFGISLWIPNALMVLLATVAVLLITMSAAAVLPRRMVMYPAALAVGLGLYGGLDATHHWFSTVAALAALLILLHGTQRRHIISAGLLCGVMASFTQSKGALVTLGFVVYLVWHSLRQTEPASQRWRRCVLLCGSAFAAFLVFNAYFMIELGLREWARWVLLFPFRYYPTMPGQTLDAPIIDFKSHAGGMRWIGALFLYCVVPLSYLTIWRMMWRREKSNPDQRCDGLFLISITGVTMFLSVTPSLSIMRASAASFPAAILLTWQIGQLPRRLRWIKSSVITIAILCAINLAASVQISHWYNLALPAGRAAIHESERHELYLWMKEHTHAGQPYFGIAPLSLPLLLQCPAPIQAPGPWEYYRPEHIARSIDAMEAARIPYIVLRRDERFKGTPGYDPEHIRLLEQYVDRHYHRIRRFATGDEVWERDTDESAIIR